MNEIDREALRGGLKELQDTKGLNAEWWRLLEDTIWVLDSADAQLAALRDERDRAVRCLRVLLNGDASAMRALTDTSIAMDFYIPNGDFAPGDFDYLRQLIESEEGQ